MKYLKSLKLVPPKARSAEILHTYLVPITTQSYDENYLFMEKPIPIQKNKQKLRDSNTKLIGFYVWVDKEIKLGTNNSCL